MLLPGLGLGHGLGLAHGLDLGPGRGPGLGLGLGLGAHRTEAFREKNAPRLSYRSAALASPSFESAR